MRAEHELVEAVVLGIAAPHALERVLERFAYLFEVERQAGRAHDDVLDRDRRAVAADLVHVLGQHADAEILEQWNDFRQRDVAAKTEYLEMQCIGTSLRAIQIEPDIVDVDQGRGELDIGSRVLRRDLVDVTGG